MSEENLPVILVSALNINSANKVISELIDNGPETNGSTSDHGDVPWQVWHITNKYYEADVRMWPHAESPPPPQAVEAHVIYLEENEFTDEIFRQRANEVSNASNIEVRLVLTESSEAPMALEAAARELKYELVPLREQPDVEDEEDHDNAPFPEQYGPRRARAALHAHTWRGLRRTRGSAPLNGANHYSEDSDSEDSEQQVERAERFADMLGALGELRGSFTDGETPEQRDRRLARAEDLLAAFCQALGPMEPCPPDIDNQYSLFDK